MADETNLNGQDNQPQGDKLPATGGDDKNKPGDKGPEAKADGEGEKGKEGEGEAGKEKTPPKVEDKTPKRDRAQERINEITKSRRIAEGDAARVREVLKLVTGTEPPKPTDFKTPAEYTAAFMDYATKVEIPKARLQEAEGRMADADNDYVETLSERWTERIESEKAADPDWEKDMKSLRVKAAPEANLAIMESDYGTKILKYLAKNPDEAHDLVSLSPQAQVRRIGFLESKVQSAAPSKDAPAGKEKERPNDPPDNSVKGGKGGGGSKDPSKMSMAEYRKFRGLD